MCLVLCNYETTKLKFHMSHLIAILSNIDHRIAFERLILCKRYELKIDKNFIKTKIKI